MDLQPFLSGARKWPAFLSNPLSSLELAAFTTHIAPLAVSARPHSPEALPELSILASEHFIQDLGSPLRFVILLNNT